MIIDFTEQEVEHVLNGLREIKRGDSTGFIMSSLLTAVSSKSEKEARDGLKKISDKEDIKRKQREVANEKIDILIAKILVAKHAAADTSTIEKILDPNA